MRTTNFYAITIPLVATVVACGDPCPNEHVASAGVDILDLAPACPDETSDGGSTGGACEPIPPGTWEPCGEGDACGPGLLCLHFSAGSTLCAPGCGADGCPGDLECHGGACDDAGACLPACESDADCPLDGTSCDLSIEHPTCVWPGEPGPDPSCGEVAGAAYGPCLADGSCGAGLECLSTALGSICAPACEAYCDAACEAELSDIDSHVCREQDGGSWCSLNCVIPAPGVDTCGDGLVCDPAAGYCVWPH